jgi:hypothetical protein
LPRAAENVIVTVEPGSGPPVQATFPTPIAPDASTAACTAAALSFHWMTFDCSPPHASRKTHHGTIKFACQCSTFALKVIEKLEFIGLIIFFCPLLCNH